MHANHGLVNGETSMSGGFQAICLRPGTQDHNLERMVNKAFNRQSITAGIKAEVLHNSGKGLERVLGNFAVLRAPA